MQRRRWSQEGRQRAPIEGQLMQGCSHLTWAESESARPDLWRFRLYHHHALELVGACTPAVEPML